MSESEDSTRPISVAELLARNGTIGSPPVGGRRRRRRRNSEGVSVAELTGEIPIVRTGEIPVAAADTEAVAEEADEDQPEEAVAEVAEVAEAAGEDDASVAAAVSEEFPAQAFEAISIEALEGSEAVDEPSDQAPEEASDDIVVAQAEVQTESAETVVVDQSAAEPEIDEPYVEQVGAALEEADPDGVREDLEGAEVFVAESVEPVQDESAPEAAVILQDGPPPRSSDPVPHRGVGPQRSYDPRPARRSSGAEEMAYDPVDESVSLDDLVDEHVDDPEQLRSYLQASQDTLFSGGTVADDLARRGLTGESGDEDGDHQFGDDLKDGTADRAAAAVSAPAVPRRLGNTVWNGVAALLQSLFAVVFGAGLFIGFDQLWRWNNLVALILSVLVVLTLAAAVRIVRKTEDIVSTLTAVAVGLLVTLGPLALQST